MATAALPAASVPMMLPSSALLNPSKESRLTPIEKPLIASPLTVLLSALTQSPIAASGAFDPLSTIRSTALVPVHALRLLAAALTAAFVLAVNFDLIRSCGSEAGAPSEGGNAGSTNGLEEASTTGETTGEAHGEAAKPEEPYAAIPSPADARVTGPESAPVEGVEDLSDGPLKENRLVAYYGTPQSEYMGVLGESAPEAMMARLEEQAAAYSAIDPSRPAIPTVEVIASVA